jgi:hypothetical protein
MPRRAAAAAAAPDGKIYLVGGLTGSGLSTATMEIFDGTSWTLAPARLSVARSHLGAAADDRGRIWVVSGNADSGVNVRNVDVYQNGTFSAGPMTVIGHANLRVVFANGRLYLFDNALDEVLDLTQSSPAWVMALDRPSADDSIAAVVLKGAPVVIGDGSSRQLVQTYSDMLHAWTMLPSLATPRVFHGGAVDCAGRLYAVGGENPTGGAIYGTVETLDLNATTWQTAPRLLQPRTDLSVRPAQTERSTRSVA